MKFTKSFPAKASANESVPANTVNFSMLIRSKYCITPISTVHPTRQYAINSHVCPSIQTISSCGRIGVSLSPLKIAK
jgi:hypothetical protein